MNRGMVRCLLAVVVLAVCMQASAAAPAQFAVVEQFAARLSAGWLTQVRNLLSTDVFLAEHDLTVRVAVGPEAHARFRAMVAEGARLEVTFESASADGAVIVTREQMWLDDAPEHVMPLRSTGVYVVDGGRIHSITRVLGADQRDTLMREAVVGAWRFEGTYVLSYRADGTYDIERNERPFDSGDYTVEGGVLRIVSNEQAQACQPGHVGTWWLAFTDLDLHTINKIEDMCAPRAGPTVGLGRMSE